MSPATAAALLWLVLTVVALCQADWVQLPAVAPRPATVDNTTLLPADEAVSPADFLRSVERSLFQQGPPQHLTGKLQLLESLRESLLSSAEERLQRLWTPEGRQARHDKGMGFPSQEGALMTIAFLLFAVYLVKLVQQLIQSLQGAAIPTTVMLTGTGRKRRNAAETLASAEVLRLIDQFTMRHPQDSWSD